MKFYRDYVNKFFNYWGITNNKLTAIHHCYSVTFFKNGLKHNIKNAAYTNGKYKQFFLNDKCYGYEKDFTKESWHIFAKDNILKPFYNKKLIYYNFKLLMHL
jgi:hypothetical protein